MDTYTSLSLCMCVSFPFVVRPSVCLFQMTSTLTSLGLWRWHFVIHTYGIASDRIFKNSSCAYTSVLTILSGKPMSHDAKGKGQYTKRARKHGHTDRHFRCLLRFLISLPTKFKWVFRIHHLADWWLVRRYQLLWGRNYFHSFWCNSTHMTTILSSVMTRICP